jgi:hypothetical protein
MFNILNLLPDIALSLQCFERRSFTIKRLVAKTSEV